MTRRLLVLALGALLGVALASCTPPPPRVLATTADLGGARFVVGGGPTDELELLCQLTVAAVEAAGAGASDQCARDAAADVGLPPERSFVDTGWAYAPAREPGVVALAPAAFSAGDAVVVAGSRARTLSELAAGPTPSLCVPPGPAGTATLDRLAAYRLAPEVRERDPAAGLVEVARGGCDAAVVPATSGRVPALGLVPLVDDRGALPRPEAAPILRGELLARHGGVAAVLGVITPRLTDDTMRVLNREVTQDGRDARDVARDWLRAQGLA